MRARKYITKGYQAAKLKFSQVADPDIVQQTISTFQQLLNQNQLAIDERNIDTWRKQGWDKFLERVEELSFSNTKTSIKRKKVKGNSITIYEDNNWLVVVPLDKDASCFYGKDTDWCTTKLFQRNFEDYFYKRAVTLIYAISKNNVGHCAIAVEPNKPTDYFNKKDRKITANQFQHATGLDPNHLITLAHNTDNTLQLDKSRTLYKDAMIEIPVLLNISPLDHKKLVPLLTITKDPTLCATYVVKYHKEIEKLGNVSDTILINAASSIAPGSVPTKELIDAIDLSTISISVIRTLCKYHPEIIISKHNELTPSQFQLITEYPKSALLYAEHIIKGPWLLGEPAILTSATASCNYARDVIKGPWLLGEPIILTSAIAACSYAINVINDPLTETIHRWLAGESIIATDPNTASFYAYVILKHRWPKDSEAEDVILTDAYCAADYAINVIKDQWPEAESLINTNPETLEMYTDFLKSKEKDNGY